MKMLRAIAIWLRKNVPKVIPDALAIMGGIAIAHGAFQVYVPAGWIVAGALLIGAAVIFSKGSDSG